MFARSVTASGQRMACHWGGDSESTVVAMALLIRGGVSLGTTGFGNWSHNIGGVERLPPANLYKRWVCVWFAVYPLLTASVLGLVSHTLEYADSQVVVVDVLKND